ncbi:helix-turn-helix domain-containing protein [Solwaraspora sp. WMMD791]|uniref:helix-turn-helix domain-containing protein n=1 Tax=Solwaraspora sp. WMMD791 TaxID=3016086 RepID=UPI00249B1E13|nr:helix-turn-helix domain-containing protein [Solwaraspora sp. WMMD791]WFE29324.1 helix-turn-helix domain-containing protein [Solwaraspora sp. WMMD791]
MQHDQFGDLLRTLRLERRLTQEELAEAAGSSVRSIREMERGRVRSPQRRTVVLLADALRLAGADRDRFVALARAEWQPHNSPAVPYDGVAAPHDRPEVPHDRPEVLHGRLAVVVPGELPSAVPDLAGRAEILQRLATLAAEVAAGRPDTSSVVVLHGPPGIGKTSLAVAAGHRLSWASSSTCRVPRRTDRSTRPRRWPDCCGRSGCRTAGCRCRWRSGAACSAP